MSFVYTQLNDQTVLLLTIQPKSFVSTQFKYQIVLFDSQIGSYRVLPCQARMHLRVIAMKGCSALPKAPVLLESYHHIVSYPGHWGGGLKPLQRCCPCIPLSSTWSFRIITSPLMRGWGLAPLQRCSQCIPQSSTWLFKIITRTLIWRMGSYPLCWDAVSVFYSPSQLGWNVFQTDLFGPNRFYHCIREGLRGMAIKGYTTFFRSPEMGPHYQMQLHVIPGTIL